MGWEIFIIPLIAFAVWVLQYVFKPPEEENKKQQANRPRPAPAPRQGPGPNRPKRQVNDLDRFLDETRKRKQQEERQPVVIAEVAPDQPLDRSEQVERERKAAANRAPSPGSARPQRPERRPQRQQPSPLLERSMPVLLEMAPVEVTRPPTPVPMPPPPSLVLPRESAPAQTQAARVGQRPPSPVLGELLKMLKKPQGIAMAVILNEILEPPLSHRRS